MFVQVIKGKTADPDALYQRMEQWKKELAPGADGWLGSTAGVTDDGTFIATAEFESAEAARRNSDRPEQGEWWSKTEPLLDDVQFTDAEETMTFLNGPDDAAKFVQVMESEVKDPQRAKAMGELAANELPQARPDVLGGVVAMHGDRATQIIYFSDEQSAREGEARASTTEELGRMAEMDEVFGATEYYDLRNPVHHRP